MHNVKIQKIIFMSNSRQFKPGAELFQAKTSKIAPISLNQDPLPWVTEVKHLGNTHQSDNKMGTDIAQKRGKLIGKLNALQQEFH